MLFGGDVTVSGDSIVSVFQSALPALIFAGVILFLALIVSLFAAPLSKHKKQKKMLRFQSGMAAVMAVLISANWIALGSQYSLLSKVFTSSDGLSEETREDSRNLTQEITGEGIVLLENKEGDGQLPISSDTKLNVFGWGSTQPIYGGAGSGSVSVEYAVSLLDGLQNAGFETNENLTNFYTDYRSEAPDIGMGELDWTVVQPTIEDYDKLAFSKKQKNSPIQL